MPTKKYPAKCRHEIHLMAKNADLFWRIERGPTRVETKIIVAERMPANVVAMKAGRRRAKMMVWLFAKFA